MRRTARRWRDRYATMQRAAKSFMPRRGNRTRTGAVLAFGLLGFSLSWDPAAIAWTGLGGAYPSDAAADPVLEALDGTKVGDLSLIESLIDRGQLAPSERALLEAQRAAALLRESDAREALARYFASGDSDPRRLGRAHTMAASFEFLAGRYGEAGRHASHVLATAGTRTANENEGIERLRRMADLLADVPAQQLLHRGPGSPVPVARDKVGLIRIKIGIGAAIEEAVVDTGANLSVVSASAAHRLGLRMVGGHAAVGNSLGGGVAVRLAVADRLEIAGALLTNVVFIVMDDAALTFPVPGGYSIDAIVGLPVLRAVGRFSIDRSSFRIEPDRPIATTASNLRMSGSSPYAVVALGGRERSLFLDTGANSSLLAVRFAREYPEIVGTQELETSRAGAGGVARVHRRRIQQVPLRIGQSEVTVASLDVETEPTRGEEDRYGVLGADLLRHFERVTLDFGSMTLEVADTE